MNFTHLSAVLSLVLGFFGVRRSSIGGSPAFHAPLKVSSYATHVFRHRRSAFFSTSPSNLFSFAVIVTLAIEPRLPRSIGSTQNSF